MKTPSKILGLATVSAISTPPCNIAGSYQVTGFLMGREEGGELVFDETSGSALELGGNASTLEGKAPLT